MLAQSHKWAYKAQMQGLISIKLPFDQSLKHYFLKKYPGFKYRIHSQGLDCRHAPRGRTPHFHYRLEVVALDQEFQAYTPYFPPTISPFVASLKEAPYKGTNPLQGRKRPLIIGAGPAGLFAALRLLEYGIPSELFERGAPVSERMLAIARFWRLGDLDPENNVCFGEGGAGLFSDGKLITRIKSPHIKYTLAKLIEFGAPPEILYTKNPHLGSNKIRRIIQALVAYLTQRGCKIHYHQKVSEILFDKEQKVTGLRVDSGQVFKGQELILATGHSASDIYQHLEKQNVSMRPKDMAIGIRIEHPRRHLEKIQFGPYFQRPELGSARYHLTHNLHADSEKEKRGTFTFCMCPGGYVLSSGTDREGIVTNGMSNSGRNSPWSNAAVVTTVKTHDYDQGLGVLKGLAFQKELEKKALILSGQNAPHRLPGLNLTDYLENKMGERSKKIQKSTSSPSKMLATPLYKIFPEFINQQLKAALKKFQQLIPGFICDSSTVFAPESRTSSPVTILRCSKTKQSLSHPGLFPCGEGAGFAGGITSSAVDGVNVADQLAIKIFQKEEKEKQEASLGAKKD